MNRQGAVGLLWAAVKRLPDGEEAMRLAVERMNDRDGTNAVKRGTPDYSSTKLLSDSQLLELAADFRRKVQLPAMTKRALGPRGGRARRAENTNGNVTYLATAAELAFINDMFGLLAVDEKRRAAFIHRQTKGQGITTHTLAEKVATPLQAMLRRRGYQIVERNRVKHLVPPAKAVAT